MTDITPNQPVPEQEPLIPPQLLLYSAVFGLIVALAVAFTQPTFGIIGVAGLAIAFLSLVGWVILDPAGFRAFITGRNLRFGGTSVLVTLLLVTALVALYTVIRAQGWRIDITDSELFSLSDASRSAITALGADPTLPRVEVLGFYGSTQAGRRDRDTVLLDQYVSASGGKISYRFVNPERSPEITQQYGISRDGQIAVARLGADGQPDLSNVERIAVLTQEALTNAILRVASTGDFRAYILGVEGGLQLIRTDTSLTAGMNDIRNELVDRFKWTVEQIGVLDLIGESGRLATADADGIVLLIPGGTSALTDEGLAALREYLDAGGHALIFADAGLQNDGVALATADNLTAYLEENYGLRFEREVVLDPAQTLRGSPLSIFTSSFNRDHPITRGFTSGNRTINFVFDIAHPITVAEAPPENVTVTPLITSGNSAYTKTVADILAENRAQTEGDATGPFTLAAVAENTENGSRVVLVGSTSLLLDRYSQFLDVGNFVFVFNSIVWSTRFNEYFTGIEQVPRLPRPQDAAVTATAQQLSTINFVTVIAIPFGILGLGLIVWWTGRERAAASVRAAKEG